MRKITAALGAAALISGMSVASAADIARPVYKAPPVVPAQFSWTGFYIGGHVGALHNRSSFDGLIDVTVFPAFGFLGPLFPIIVPSRFGTIPGVSASNTGFIGGGQLGYNWQAGNFLLGLEGDASWTRARTNAAFVVPDPFGIQTLTGGYTTSIDWTASLRGRVGLVWDRFLVYATGGAAFAKWNVGSTFTLVNPTPAIFAPVPGASGTTAFGTSFTDVGWTIGGGLEWALSDNWSVAGEYRHSRFGSRSIRLASTDPSGIILTGPPLTTNVRLTTDQVTLRLNYRFGPR